MLRTLSLLFAAFSLAAQSSDEKDAIAAVQKAFDAIASHSAALLRASMLPDAWIYSARDEATPAGLSAEEMATRIVATPGALLERFTGPPLVSIHGRIAQVWGEYEFLRDGKFSHCGVDSFSLLKTPEGWKIATIVYTAETKGCKGH